MRLFKLCCLTASLLYFNSVQAQEFFATDYVGKVDAGARLAQLSTTGAGKKAGGGAPFTPASLTGLLAWYSADFGVYNDAGVTPATNGQTVQQWNDQSGNNYHLSNAFGSQRPTYGTTSFNSTFKGISFNAAAVNFIETGYALTALQSKSAQSWFIVCKQTYGGGAARLFAVSISGDADTSPTGAALLYSGAATGLSTYQNGTNPSTTIVDATNYRLGVIFDSANVTQYVNNVGGGTAASTWTTSASPYLLSIASSGGGGNPSTVVVAEVVGTTSALNSTDRTNLDNYFKTHWGL